MAPKVSVIIPTFNRWPLLKEALKSVQSQTFKDYEVIVIDDGSTDSTENGVTALGLRGLRYIKLSRNGGPAAARNAGLNRARGVWIAFLDSDDLWYPEKLSLQLNYVRRSGCRLVFTDYEFLTKEGRRPSLRPGPKNWVSKNFNLVPLTSTVMVRKDLILRVGSFDTHFRHLFDDHDMWRRLEGLLPARSWGLLDKPLVVYRGHRGRLTGVHSKLFPGTFSTTSWDSKTLTPKERDILLDTAYYFCKKSPIRRLSG